VAEDIIKNISCMNGKRHKNTLLTNLGLYLHLQESGYYTITSKCGSYGMGYPSLVITHRIINLFYCLILDAYDMIIYVVCMYDIIRFSLRTMCTDNTVRHYNMFCNCTSSTDEFIIQTNSVLMIY